MEYIWDMILEPTSGLLIGHSGGTLKDGSKILFKSTI